MVIYVQIKKGDLVSRNSYNNDTVFKVINIVDGVCYLKGVGDKKGAISVVNSGVDASANTAFISDEGVVPMVTLDEDIGEAITIIKADIEGFEQAILRGAVNHIKNDHPKLLISVYHKNEDLWKIPKMLKEIRDSGFGTSVINLKNTHEKDKKDMLIIHLNKSKLKRLTKIIRKNDPDAFVVINENKYIQNGLIK